VEKKITEAEMTTATMIELPRAFQKSTVSKTSATFFQNCPPGNSGGHVWVSAVLSREPMMNDQYSG